MEFFMIITSFQTPLKSEWHAKLIPTQKKTRMFCEFSHSKLSSSYSLLRWFLDGMAPYSDRKAHSRPVAWYKLSLQTLDGGMD